MTNFKKIISNNCKLSLFCYILRKCRIPFFKKIKGGACSYVCFYVWTICLSYSKAIQTIIDNIWMPETRHEND